MTAERTKDPIDRETVLREWEAMVVATCESRGWQNDEIELRKMAENRFNISIPDFASRIARITEARVRAEMAAKLADLEAALHTYRRMAEAKSPPLSSSPVARAEVSEEVVAMRDEVTRLRKNFDEQAWYSIALQRCAEYHSRGEVIPHEVAKDAPYHAEMLNKRLASLSSAPQDAAAVRGVDPDYRRESELAWAEVRKVAPYSSGAVDCLAAAIAHIASLAAPRSVTLSDGSVVRCLDENLPERWRRYEGDGPAAKLLEFGRTWRSVLRDTDTGADFDAVKRLAGEVAKP